MENIDDLKAKAEQGDSWAQNNLGLCFYNGEGVSKDPERAVYWWLKAEEQGCAGARLHLGIYFYFKALENLQRNPEKTASWSEAAGWISEKIIPDDLKMAEYWWTKAAKQDDATAKLILGAFYDNAEYGPRDFGKALYWYTKAANQGDSEAQVRLGKCYILGKGIPEDMGKGVYWLSMSAMQGNDAANELLA
jgi:TPR repeat protein